MKIKIALIGGVSNFDIIKGGVESVVYNLSTRFNNFSEIEFYLLGNNIKERSIGNTHFRNLTFPIPLLGTTINLILFRYKIINLIDEAIKPDIFHFQGTIPYLLLLNKKIRYRSVITQHAILSEEIKYQTNFHQKIKFGIKVLLERYNLKKIKNLIFISKYNLDFVFNQYPSMKNIRHQLIHNPVHPIFFNKYNINDNSLKLYYVGELKKRKGLHDLLYALKILAERGINIKLEVIGDFIEPEYQKFIFSIIAHSNIKELVSFHGWQNKEGIIKISSQCNVFVLPSYQETLPVSIAEAMALKKVVIATNLPGVKEMIEDGKSGLLYSKGNINELTDKIEFLFNNLNLLVKIGEAASARAKSMFDPNNILKETIDFYKEIILDDMNQT